MAKMLTEKEWLNYNGDFFWMEHKDLIIQREKANNTALKNIIIKWCTKNLKNWFYFEEDYWIFSSKSDAAIVKSVVISGYFDQSHGEVN